MRTRESIKNEIRDLMRAYAQNNVELKREAKAGRTMRLPELIEARAHILLSVAHRQGLLIEILENEMEYTQPKREAA